MPVTRGRSIEIVACGNGAVPEELKPISVPFVRAALAHHHRLASHHHSVFRAIRAGQDLVLSNSLHAQCVATDRCSWSAKAIHHLGTIQQIVVRTNRGPVAAYPRPSHSATGAHI